MKSHFKNDGQLNSSVAANASDTLIRAAKDGHTEVVLALLKGGQADPAAQDSSALGWAAIKGHTHIVRALLEDGRADPRALGSRALTCAIRFGHTEIVRMLLRDGRSVAAAHHPFAFLEAVQGRYVDVVCLVFAAMDPTAVPAVAKALLRRSDLPDSVAAFIHASITNPTITRMLKTVRALLKTDLPAQTILSLAHESARRNMDAAAVLHVVAQEHIVVLLQHMLGPTVEMPTIDAIGCHPELAAFASVSKTEPVPRAGELQLDLQQYPKIVSALAPTLSPHAAHAVWQVLRAQARGEERHRFYGTPAERVRDRIAARVLEGAQDPAPKAEQRRPHKRLAIEL